jgi:transposase InsO family protein
MASIVDAPHAYVPAIDVDLVQGAGILQQSLV